MSEFLRRHLADLKQLREQLLHEEADGFIINSLSYLIGNVEAHQHVIKLKRPAPIDYQKVRELAKEHRIPLPPRNDAVDWKEVFAVFRIEGIEIPTIPSIYENPHPKRSEEEAPDDE